MTEVALDVALDLLQLIALAVPPIAVLIQMLKEADDISWNLRRFSFGLAIAALLAFIGAGTSVIVFLITAVELPLILQVGSVLVVIGLIPFALFTGVLYREHKLTFK